MQAMTLHWPPTSFYDNSQSMLKLAFLTYSDLFHLQGHKVAQRQGGALTIKHTAARKGKGPAGAGRAGPPGSDLERKVVNCLSCGKVYDFRQAAAGQLTNDLLRFLGMLFTCMPAFCRCERPSMLSWYAAL